MKRIAAPFVFFGSARFSVAVLRRILKTLEPSLIVTLPAERAGRGMQLAPNPVYAFAAAEGLPVLAPEKVSDAWQAFDEIRPAFGLVAGYGKILKKTLSRLAMYNLHPSLLPKYRGVSPIRSALLTGERETGVTLFVMDEGIDRGPVIAKRSIPIAEEWYHDELEDRLGALGGELFLEHYKDLQSGSAHASPQDEREATLTKPFVKEDGLLSAESAPAALLKVRAFEGWPGAFVRIQIRVGKNKEAKLLKIIRARAAPENDAGIDGKKRSKGEFYQRGKEFTLRCGDGTLLLDEVQLEGKKRMSGREFMNGVRPDALSLLASETLR